MTDTSTSGAKELCDYEEEFRRWWRTAVHPTVTPSVAAARTHVLFAQHMVLLELEAVPPPAPCPYIVTGDEGTSYCRLAERAAQEVTR